MWEGAGGQLQHALQHSLLPNSGASSSLRPGATEHCCAHSGPFAQPAYKGRRQATAVLEGGSFPLPILQLGKTKAEKEPKAGPWREVSQRRPSSQLRLVAAALHCAAPHQLPASHRPTLCWERFFSKDSKERFFSCRELEPGETAGLAVSTPGQKAGWDPGTPPPCPQRKATDDAHAIAGERTASHHAGQGHLQALLFANHGLHPPPLNRGKPSENRSQWALAAVSREQNLISTGAEGSSVGGRLELCGPTSYSSPPSSG